MKRHDTEVGETSLADQRLVEELLVARCLADDLKQQQIADILGKSQAHVSRLSRNNPHLHQPSPWYSPTLSEADQHRYPELIALVDQKMNVHKARLLLESLSGDGGFKVDVVYGKSPIVDQRLGFDRRVAKYLSKLIGRCRVVGLAWEHGIKPPSIEIPGFVRRYANSGEIPIRFVPLCGITSSSQESLVKSSTVIAMDYHHLVNRGYPPEEHRLLNLNCIPMVHPRVHEPAGASIVGDAASREQTDDSLPDSIEVMRYIRKAFPDYELIFGPMNPMTDAQLTGPPNAPLVDQADMIVSGIGTAEDGTRTTLDQLYPDFASPIPCEWAGRRGIGRKELLETIVVGDVAGVLLPRLDVDHDERNRAIVRQLNARLATLRARHLLACVARRRQQQRDAPTLPAVPGVVLVADGADKADAVMTAVRLGYVSRLIIDDRLASALGGKYDEQAESVMPGMDPDALST